MDVVTYVLSKKYAKTYTDTCISSLPKGMTYKGAVNYQADLPSTGQSNGDVYTVKYKGTSGTEAWGMEFVWGNYEGTNQWIQLGGESESNLFIATYDNSSSSGIKTSFADINNAIDAGKDVVLYCPKGSHYGGAMFLNMAYRPTNKSLIAFSGVQSEYVHYIYVTSSDTWSIGKWEIQSKLNSGSNIKTVNGDSLLGSGNVAIKTYQAFPSSFVVDGTVQEFVNSVVAYSGFEKGMAWMGQLECSDLPSSSLSIVECTVLAMKSNTSSASADGIILITAYSADVSPYHWEYNSYNPGWRSWTVN